MIHIDHSLLPNATLPPSEPALPILASHLLQLEEQQRQRFSHDGRPKRLSSGCKEVDEVLGSGGVERGVVLGISAPLEGREGRLLSLHLLASSLLSNLPQSAVSSSRPPKTKATIIDTNGSFPLALLASVLSIRLSEARSLAIQNAVKTGNHAVQEPAPRRDDVDIDDQVQQCLEMVAISRVFDVEGLWEVIGEVDHAVSSSSPRLDGEDGNGKADLNDADEQEVRKRVQGNKTPEILDSEEDTTPPRHVPPLSPKEGDNTAKDDEGVEIIVIDSMTHLINELFARKEKSDAHNLLTLLSSTLHTLSKTNNILTILHNATNPITTSYPQANQRHNQTSALQTLPIRSIFSSAAQKPALGQIFAQFPDIHLLLHPLPRGRRDAELLYGGGDANTDIFNNDAEGEERDAVRYTTVLEVLKDEAPSLAGDNGGGRKKFAYREQKWTAIDVSRDGLGLKCSFEERGGAKNAKTSVEEGLSGGVGNVAKIWGFGGRRV